MANENNIVGRQLEKSGSFKATDPKGIALMWIGVIALGAGAEENLYEIIESESIDRDSPTPDNATALLGLDTWFRARNRLVHGIADVDDSGNAMTLHKGRAEPVATYKVYSLAELQDLASMSIKFRACIRAIHGAHGTGIALSSLTNAQEGESHDA